MSSLWVRDLRGERSLGHGEAEGTGGGDQRTLRTLQHLRTGSDLLRVDDVRVRAKRTQGLDHLVALQGGDPVHEGVGVANSLYRGGVVREGERAAHTKEAGLLSLRNMNVNNSCRSRGCGRSLHNVIVVDGFKATAPEIID